jgi:hypothetical protein
MYVYVSRDGLKPIGPIASNWALRLRGIVLVLYTLGCSSTHNNTLQVVIENHWAPHLLRPALYVILCHGVFILYLNVLLLAQITHNGMWAICHHFASVVYNYFTFEFPFLSVPTPGPLHLSLLERKWSGVVFSQSENIVWFRDIRRHQLKLWRVTLSRNKQKPNMLLICELEKKISSLNHSNYSCMIIQFLW